MFELIIFFQNDYPMRNVVCLSMTSTVVRHPSVNFLSSIAFAYNTQKMHTLVHGIEIQLLWIEFHIKLMIVLILTTTMSG